MLKPLQIWRSRKEGDTKRKTEMLTRILRASPLKRPEEEGLRCNEGHWIWDLELVMRMSYKSHRILQNSSCNLIYNSQLPFSHSIWHHDEFTISFQHTLFLLLSDVGLFIKGVSQSSCRLEKKILCVKK